MLNVSFAIIMLLINIGVICMMCLSEEMPYTAIAGDCSNWYSFMTMSNRPRKEFIEINDKIIDIRRHMSLVVCGNAMREYGLYNGDRIYVKKFDYEEKRNITKYPVVVLDNKHRINDFFSRYRLLKFVGYLSDLDDFDAAFKRFENRIKLSKTLFIEDMLNSKEKLNKTFNSDNLILTESFDVKEDRYMYSLHFANELIGSAEYKN